MTKRVIDTFTEVSTTTLNFHTPDTGTGWTEEEKTGVRFLRVLGGVGDVAPDGRENTDRIFYSSQPDPSASGDTEYDVSFTLSAHPTTDDVMFGCFARWTDTDNYYSSGVWRSSGDGQRIAKKVAGVVTEIAAGGLDLFAQGSTDEYIFKIRDATTRQTWRNETQADEITADDTALTSAGKCGMCTGNYIVSTADIEVEWEIDSYFWDDLAVAEVVIFSHPLQVLQAVNRASVI